MIVMVEFCNLFELVELLGGGRESGSGSGDGGDGVGKGVGRG